jgi:signal peptidase I
MYVGASTRGVAFFLAAIAWSPLGMYFADQFRSAALCIVTLAGSLLLKLFSAVDAVRLAARPGWHQSVVSRWYVALVAALLWTFVAVPFWESNINREIAETYRVGSLAMEPWLTPGDWMLAGRKRDPIRRGDVVMYQQGVAENAVWFTHRVVALGNDTVGMRDGQLFVNGRAVKESDVIPVQSDTTVEAFAWQVSHLLPGFDTTGYRASLRSWGPFVVPPRNMFLLGDNRRYAQDSRYLGFVDTGWVWGTPRVVYFSMDPRTKRVRWERIGLRIE